MATIAIDNPAETRTPISSHPAFPIVVALWFAALLGLGSLVLPVVLLERAISATGLASLIPAASPPLGVTSRGLIALAGAVLGALFGVLIARRVARAHQPSPAARFSPAATRRPLSTLDLDEEGIAAPAPTTTRRRSLAIAEEERPSDFLASAPLPGDEGTATPLSEAIKSDDALELSELALDEPIATPGETFAAEPPAVSVQDPAMPEQPPAQFPTIEELERRRTERRSETGGTGPGGLERRLYLRRHNDEPLAFVAPSLARRVPDNENTVADTVAVTINFAPPAAAEPAAIPEEIEQVSETTADWRTAPLETLGMVQLVERLGCALEKRRELAVAPEPAAPSVPVVTPDEFDAAPAEEAAQAMAAYFGKPAEASPVREPAAEPIARMTAFAAEFDSFDEDEEDDGIMASFGLPIAREPVRPVEPIEPVEEEAFSDETDDADFGSLLSLRNPFTGPRDEFVRVDEPAAPDHGIEPAVVFPGADKPTSPAPVAGMAPARPFDPPVSGAASTPAPAPAEADEALRRALATLQRMSNG